MLVSYFVNILPNLELYLTGFNKELIANSCAGTGRQNFLAEIGTLEESRGGRFSQWIQRWMDGPE